MERARHGRHGPGRDALAGGPRVQALADRAMWGWLAVPMLVGAAGNLINDFFDVKEDRINKPKRARIGRTLKRRVVIVTHWGLSVAALCWSGALASHLGSSWPIVFTAALSVVLYIYSPMLKGRGIAGNLAVSVCVAALLVWARMATGRPLNLAGSADQMWLLATVTLWGLNVTREWVKDLQDLEGDRAAGHRTWASQLTPRQNQGGLAVNVVVWSALAARGPGSRGRARRLARDLGRPLGGRHRGVPGSRTSSSFRRGSRSPWPCSSPRCGEARARRGSGLRAVTIP